MKTGEIHRIAVIGPGLMEHGIVLEFSVAGFEVRLHDLSAGRLEEAQRRIRATLR